MSPISMRPAEFRPVAPVREFPKRTKDNFPALPLTNEKRNFPAVVSQAADSDESRTERRTERASIPARTAHPRTDSGQEVCRTPGNGRSRQSPQRQSTRNRAKAAKDGVRPRLSEQSEGAGTYLYALARSGPAHTKQSVRRQEAKSGIPNRKTGTTSTFQ